MFLYAYKLKSKFQLD